MSQASEDHGPDLVDRLLAGVDHLLDIVHDRVLRPIIMAARIVAYGFIITLVAIVFVAALLIGLVRLLNIYAFDGRVWLSYSVLGALSVITGLIIWRRRRPLKIRK